MKNHKAALLIITATAIIATGVTIQYLQTITLTQAPNWFLFALYSNLEGLGAVIAGVGALMLTLTIYIQKKTVQKELK